MPSGSPATLTGAISMTLLEDFLRVPEITGILIFDRLDHEYMERVDTSRKPEHIQGTSVPESRRSSQVDALFRLRHRQEEGCGYVYVVVNEEHESVDGLTEMLAENFMRLLDSEYASELTYHRVLPPMYHILVCPSQNGEDLDIYVREMVQLPNPNQPNLLH